jgi:hypothetical protein
MNAQWPANPNRHRIGIKARTWKKQPRARRYKKDRPPAPSPTYLGRCSCGWATSWVEVKDDAWSAALAHVEAVVAAWNTPPT